MLLTFFVAADLVFRPKFIPIYAGAESMEHATPGAVTASHFLIGVTLAGVGVYASVVSRSDFRRLVWFAPVAATLMIVATISSLTTPSWKTTSYLLMLLLSFAGAGCFAASDYAEREGVRMLLATVALGFTLVLLGALLTNEYSYGRLTARAGPNYWGMVAFMVVCGSLAVRRLSLRLLVIGISVVVMLLSQARGSLLATCVAALTIGLLALRHTSLHRRGRTLAIYVMAALGGSLFLPALLNKVFLLSDARRGLSSGGTGRGAAWNQALAAFADNPFFGVGYRRHEIYVTAAINAHNAYIAVLTEMGIFGLLAYVFLIFGAAIRITQLAWKAKNPVYTATAAFLWGFATVGMVEYQALALGSPMPNLMLFLCAFAWGAGHRSERRANGA